jgi:hypothetical protein
VESIGLGTLILQTGDGRFTVDTGRVDESVVAAVRPGDVVTVTGQASDAPGRFVAESIQARRPGG